MMTFEILAKLLLAAGNNWGVVYLELRMQTFKTLRIDIPVRVYPKGDITY